MKKFTEDIKQWFKKLVCPHDWSEIKRITAKNAAVEFEANWISEELAMSLAFGRTTVVYVCKNCGKFEKIESWGAPK